MYAPGFAILLTALAFTRMTTAFATVKRHYPVIMACGVNGTECGVHERCTADS